MPEHGASAGDEVARAAVATPEEPVGAPADASTGELLGRATTQISELVSSEMQLAKVELQATLKHTGIGAGLFGAAGILALYGVGALIACAILALALIVSAWLAALIVAVVLFVAAGVVAIVGKKQVARAAPPLEQTKKNVSKDVQAVKGSHDD